MNSYDFVHLAFYALGGEIKGRTKLQKLVYFLGIMSGQLDDLGYHAHFYGPYSEEVLDAVGRLESLGFLNVSTSGRGIVDNHGFEVMRYDYVLNDDGKTIASQKAKDYAEQWDAIKKGAAVLEQFADLDYMQLSIAAKIYFMLKQDDNKNGASAKQLAEYAKRFGWIVGEDQTLVAIDMLRKANLVAINK